MALPPVDPKNPPEWLCMCRKCRTNGKVLTRVTWYHHNPGGNRAKYEILSEREMEVFARLYTPPYPTHKAQKQHLHKEDKDPLHTSKCVAGLSLVHIML